ncbi:avidin-like [Crotalus adamanteus]|uniref:Avidin-like n=1 Tax=Crotalus adamanteus TaxID=8729 RepID=A0AAW1BDD1_CROAD
MEINSVGNTGVFSGLYKMAVSASDNPIGPSPLQGIQHQGPQPTFGFTVNWNFWLCQKARIYDEEGEEADDEEGEEEADEENDPDYDPKKDQNPAECKQQ